MQRTGRTNAPSFRIVVVEHTESTKTGNFVEKLGTYNPKTKERNLSGERIKYWLSVGAKASGTMHNMLISTGIIEGKKVNVLPRKSPPKKEPSSAEATEGREEAAKEAPAAEVPADSTNPPQAEAAPEAKAEEPAKEEAAPEAQKEEAKTEEAPAEPDAASSGGAEKA